jgi:hypothetical protein
MHDALRVISDDDERRMMLCLGADSRLEALNEGASHLAQLIEQRTRRPFENWQWQVTAVQINEPVQGWAVIAEHESSRRRGLPFESAS